MNKIRDGLWTEMKLYYSDVSSSKIIFALFKICDLDICTHLQEWITDACIVLL